MKRDGCRQCNRTFLGIILIIIGGLYLLQTLSFLQMNVGHVVFSWGFFLFVIGILMLSGSQRTWLAILLIIVGALLLIPRIFPNISVDDSIIFPVIIIGIGFMIIFKKRTYHWDAQSHKGFTKENLNLDFIDIVSVFSGGHHTVLSNSFKGGNVTAIFGGSEIDLTNAKLAEGENVLDILTIFGGTTLYVPRDWNIIINVTPLFGGFSNKSKRDPSTPVDLSRSLIIKGLAIFGGGEIKSY
jgi:predicted membrane protein